MPALVGDPARKRAGCPVAGIHVLTIVTTKQDVDGRDKPGHDECGDEASVNTQEQDQE